MIFAIPNISVVAQDTIRTDSVKLFTQYNTQYNNERDFNDNYYYNPANMLDYSTSSFSQIYLHLNDENLKINRAVNGSKQQSYGLKTNSFQKIKPTLAIWGEAAYTSTNIKKMVWNENLDYDRISPYTVADSVGGNFDVEKYHFLGGFSKKVNRFTFGLQGNYIAQLGARSRDPRNKTITSNLSVKAGANYAIVNDLKIGAFAQIDKYTQNNVINFASLLGYPNVYQMTSFGYYNYLFSGGTSKIENQYEQLGYQIGGELSNKNGKDFYILAQFGRLDLVKSTRGLYTTFYNVADVIDDNYNLQAAKFISLNNQRLGLKISYQYKKRLGSEYGYTNNGTALQQIYKEKTYKRDITDYNAELFYQYQNNKFVATLQPHFIYQKYVEKRLRPFNGIKWTSYTYGVNADLRLNIKKNYIVSLQPFVSYKSINNRDEILSLGNNQSINEWVENEYAFLASNVTQFGTSLRFDFKVKEIPTIFAAIDWQNAKILNKNNQYLGVKLGVTF